MFHVGYCSEIFLNTGKYRQGYIRQQGFRGAGMRRLRPQVGQICAAAGAKHMTESEENPSSTPVTIV
jgi:hypothetical protein